MKKKLIDYLACPECKGPLDCEIVLEDFTLPWSEILEGSLSCRVCQHKYLISNGVPRLIRNENLTVEVSNTVDGFGWEWQKFDDQIQDSYMTDKRNFLDFIFPINDGFFQDKLVLDAGCGMGRFLKLAAELGSRDVIGVDLSDSVNLAYRNTRLNPNAHVVQADILALPFSAYFDYIFSIGVLQFLPYPQEGFNGLAQFLDDEGKLSVWVYSRENNGWAVYFLSPLRKHFTSRLPRSILYWLSRILGSILYGLLTIVYKPANENRYGSKVGKLLPYNDYLYYSSKLNYNSIVSVVFDHLVPQITSYITYQELENWFLSEGLSEIVITSRNKMSWRGLGTKDSNS